MTLREAVSCRTEYCIVVLYRNVFQTRPSWRWDFTLRQLCALCTVHGDGLPSPPISGGAQLCQVSVINIDKVNHKSYQKLGSDEAGGGQPCTGRRPSGWVACRSLLPTANRGCFKRLIALVRWACVHIVCLCLSRRLPGELVASRIILADRACRKTKFPIRLSISA